MQTPNNSLAIILRYLRFKIHLKHAEKLRQPRRNRVNTLNPWSTKALIVPC